MTRHPAAVKVRIHDAGTNRSALERSNTPPLVVWRHDGCGGRLLRLYLVPTGWLLISDDARVSLEEWITRTGIDATTDDFRDGRVGAFSKRVVEGHERLLPHATSDWPSGSFELACRQHGFGAYELGDLATDAEEARAKRRRVQRSKVPSK